MTSEPPRRRRPLTASQARLATLGIVAAAYLVSYLSTAQMRPLFAPDTRFYGGMALWFGGTSKEEAARQIAAESAKYGWASPGPHQLFGWGLTQPRVVYPGLSTPFVKIWGIPGLAVVPAVAMAALVVVLTVLLARRWGNVAAIATMLLICASPQLVFYGVAMLTESLTALWSALLLAMAWRHARNPNVAAAVGMVVLTVVSAFTRQATLIPAGAFVVAWLVAMLQRHRPNPWKVPALTVGATAVAVQLLQMWWFPGFSQVDQFKMRTGEDTLAGALAQAPDLAWHIVKVDVSRLAAADHALLMLLALALVSMVVFWRRAESHLLLGALLAYELYNVTNGVPTTFRYGMPGLVFVAASVAMLCAEAGGRLTRTAVETDEPAATPD
jgi:hypothetical protein